MESKQRENSWFHGVNLARLRLLCHQNFVMFECIKIFKDNSGTPPVEWLKFSPTPLNCPTQAVHPNAPVSLFVESDEAAGTLP